MVTAAPEVHAKIAAMVEELDQPTEDGGARREHVYRLKHAKAATLAAMLGTLYPATTSNARFLSGGADDLLIVVASETLQASVRRILASAIEELQAKISAIVEQFDKAPSDDGPPVEYRVYPLRFATPDALATALSTVFETLAAFVS